MKVVNPLEYGVSRVIEAQEKIQHEGTRCKKAIGFVNVK